ncbi:MAG: hypothetical protein ACK5P5_01635 [Pseudobdellovibrionaceae bacterium]
MKNKRSSISYKGSTSCTTSTLVILRIKYLRASRAKALIRSETPRRKNLDFTKSAKKSLQNFDSTTTKIRLENWTIFS